MVFGFGKKKAPEQPSVPPPQMRGVTLQEVPPMIKSLEVPRISALLREARRLRGEIETSQKVIYEIVSQLETDDLKLDEIDRNLRIIGQRGKDSVVSTIKKETKARLSSVESYDDVIALNNEVNQMFKKIGDVLGLHTRVMHVFARKYADKLKEAIAELAQRRNSLQNIISEHEKFKTNSRSMLECAERISSLNQEQSSKAERTRQVIKEKTDLSESITSLEQEISVMKASKEYGQFLEIRNKIDELEHEKRSIKDKINDQFSKISRPLNKYSYVSALEKHLKKTMEEMISDPYQVLNPENKGPIIEILEAVTKSVLAGNVSVKDADKSIEAIEETIGRLDEFLGLKAAHSKKVSDLESKLKVFDSIGLENKVKEMEKARSKMHDLDSTGKRLEKEFEENRLGLESARSDLERGLNLLSNDKIQVNIQTHDVPI